jgi:hypothetical protein
MYPCVLLVWGDLTSSFVTFAKGDATYSFSDLSRDINRRAWVLTVDPRLRLLTIFQFVYCIFLPREVLRECSFLHC